MLHPCFPATARVPALQLPLRPQLWASPPHLRGGSTSVHHRSPPRSPQGLVLPGRTGGNFPVSHSTGPRSHSLGQGLPVTRALEPARKLPTRCYGKGQTSAALPAGGESTCPCSLGTRVSAMPAKEGRAPRPPRQTAAELLKGPAALPDHIGEGGRRKATTKRSSGRAQPVASPLLRGERARGELNDVSKHTGRGGQFLGQMR